MPKPAPPTQQSSEPPGPGAWDLERAHMTGPVTPFMGAIFAEGMARGTADCMRRYGVLLDYIELGVSNSFLYSRAQPAGAPRGATGSPPKLVIQLLTRLHPELRRRVRASATLFDRKPWRDELREWDEQAKPASIRANLELVAVEPSKLAPEAFAEHLTRCRENVLRMIVQHHRFMLATSVAVGDLFAHVKAWTNLPAEELPWLLEGFSPISANITEQSQRLREALAKDPAARALLDGTGAPAEVLAALAAAPGKSGEAMREYLDFAGYRLVNGVDVSFPYALEVPDLLLESVRRLVSPPRAGVEQEVARRTTRAREAVPAEHRETFDALLAEARLVYRLRDERSVVGDLWAIGIARRAIVDLGRRAKEAGRVRDSQHVFEASLEEMLALARGDAGAPTAETLAERAARRGAMKLSDAPLHVGGPAGKPPPPEWLPVPARRLARAVDAVLVSMFQEPESRTAHRKVHGLAVGSGKYEGTARVVLHPSELGRVRQGDVLVTGATTAAFNMALPLLGALVTDRGGMLCHAAIVARECGIPAVVGSSDATRVIPDGSRVRVDGSSGLVEVLG